MDREEKQKRRAENLVWNAAGDYGIRSRYLAFDERGEADPYWNYVIGAAHRRYDFSRLEKMFRYLEKQKDGAAYVELFWLGLESCLYEGDRPDRPALEPLRREWAASFLLYRKERLRRSLEWKNARTEAGTTDNEMV